MGAQTYDQSCRLDGEPSAIVAVFQLPGSNALDVANRVKARMEELKSRFPPGLEYRIVYDTTPFIRQSIDEVINTLVEAVFLVAVVVLFFLQDWKAMILPMIDVPVSLVGTFAVLALLGFTLNNLTLFGLVLAIGIVVDDAIVVLENIERLIATGLDARTATIKAMDEMTGPIVAITLVLSSVFIPSIFIPGLTGQFYRQFAVTIATAVIISAVNALTLTPSRAVSIFRTEEIDAHGEPKKEALPWWIFAVVGGLLTVWLAQPLARRDRRTADGRQRRAIATVAAWACARPGLFPEPSSAGVVGWFIIRPVNAVLGAIFRAFNRLFERVTAALRMGGRQAAAGGRDRGSRLLRPALRDRVGRDLRPQGIHPHAGPRLSARQCAASRFGVAAADRSRSCTKLNDIAHRMPGVAHTVAISGTSFLLSTNGSNLGSMFVVLKDYSTERTHDRV